MLAPPAFYFRKGIAMGSKEDFAYPEIRFVRDDGIVVYFNGAEVLRGNLPGSDIKSRDACGWEHQYG